MDIRRPSATLLAGTLLAGLFALLLALATGGIGTSFIDPDESAHYVNALFLGDWLRAGLPGPMGFARDYYAHFPRLTIGHWPPGWYALLAPLHAVARPGPRAAMMIAAFVAGLPAGLILWAGRRALGSAVAALAALAYLLLPLVVGMARAVLLDQPVTLVAGIAAILWLRAAERPIWGRMLAFAAFAAAAPLVKGNGALVALIPPLHIALTGRWRLLRRSELWVAGAVALLVVAPWYLVSFRISAGGFNYAPGPAYAWLALRTNCATIFGQFGPGGVMLAAAGLLLAWRERAARPEAARLAALAAVVIVATLLFQSLVPAALEPRYVAPALPWLVLLAALGALGIANSIPAARGGGRLIAAVLLLWALVPSGLALVRLAPKTDLGAPDIAARMKQAGGVWLVDGRAGDEGGIIAAAAYADDRAHRIWVARASQWLSTSDFMGRGYRLTARTPAETRAVLDRLGAQGVVAIEEHDRTAYPHSALLQAALAGGGFRREVRPFATGAGHAIVAVRTVPVRPHPELLSGGSGSANLARLRATIG